MSGAVALKEHGVYTVFVELGNTKIEVSVRLKTIIHTKNSFVQLLHPLGDKSPIQKFLEKNKSGGIHHICIEVNENFIVIGRL